MIVRGWARRGVQVRRADAVDRGAILTLALEFVEAQRPVVPLLLGGATAFTIGRFVDLVFNFEQRAGVFVAEDDGGVFGFIAVVLDVRPMTGDPFAAEVAWFVTPGRRGARAGPALLEAAEAFARENRIDVIQLVALAGSHVGTFLERRGYAPVETTYLKDLTDGLQPARSELDQ